MADGEETTSAVPSEAAPAPASAPSESKADEKENSSAAPSKTTQDAAPAPAPAPSESKTDDKESPSAVTLEPAPVADTKTEDKVEEAVLEAKPSALASLGNEIQKSISNFVSLPNKSSAPTTQGNEGNKPAETPTESGDGKDNEVAEKNAGVGVDEVNEETREEAPTAEPAEATSETEKIETHEDPPPHAPSPLFSKHSKLSARTRSTASKRSYIFKKSLSKISHQRSKHTGPKKKEKDIQSSKDEESVPAVLPSGTEIENEEHKMHDEMLKKYAGEENVESAKSKMKELLTRGSSITNIDSIPTQSMSMVSHSVVAGTERGMKKEGTEDPGKVLSPDLVKENTQSSEQEDEKDDAQNDETTSVKSKRSTKSGLFNIFLHDASKGSKVSTLSKQSSLDESQEENVAKALLGAKQEGENTNAHEKGEKEIEGKLSQKVKAKGRSRSSRREDDLSAKRAAIRAMKGNVDGETDFVEEEEEEKSNTDESKSTKSSEQSEEDNNEKVTEAVDENKSSGAQETSKLTSDDKTGSGKGKAGVALAAATVVGAGYMVQSEKGEGQSQNTADNEQEESFAASSTRQLALYAEGFLTKSTDRLKGAMSPLSNMIGDDSGDGGTATTSRDLQATENEEPSSPLDLLSEWFGGNKTGNQRTWFDDNLPTTCAEGQTTLENAQSSLTNAFKQSSLWNPSSMMLMRLCSPETCQRQANRCQPNYADEQSSNERGLGSIKNSSKVLSGVTKTKKSAYYDQRSIDAAESEDSEISDSKRSEQIKTASESIDMDLEKAIRAGEESLRNLDPPVDAESRTVSDVDERDREDLRATPPPSRVASSKYIGSIMNEREEVPVPTTPSPTRKFSKGAAIFEKKVESPSVISKGQKKQKPGKQKKEKKQKVPKMKSPKQKAPKSRSLSPKRGARDSSPTRPVQTGKSAVVRQGLSKKKRIFG